MGGFLGFCYRQLTFKPQPLPGSISLSSRTALITGANSGIGAEAAHELAARGIARLILAVRDVSKGEKTKVSILRSSPNCMIDVWNLDHDSYESIVEFQERVRRLETLDYVVLNAGVKMMQYATSHAGHEMNVQINHIATAAVSLAVLPVLRTTAVRANAPVRMTIVSSEGHFWIPFKERSAPNILSHMDNPKTFGTAMQRYYTSKLLNVLWTREFASRVSAEEVIINTVNPGFCYSGLHRHESTGIIKIFLWLFGWSSVQGGHCLVDAVVKHEGSHGRYLSEQRETP
jgi:retinol dehydrogenase 12